MHKGFVYKRVPHVTLKTIANNPDIREGMTREEIDAAIARHAETRDARTTSPTRTARHRAGDRPFTVESLSPHRVLDDDRPTSRPARSRGGDGRRRAVDFEQMILDNLRKAGVQKTDKGEELRFDRLDLFPGEWIQAEGESPTPTGEARRVAVSLGPEYGTVGPDQIKDAAKEAMRAPGSTCSSSAASPSIRASARRPGVRPTGEGFEVAVGKPTRSPTVSCG